MKKIVIGGLVAIGLLTAAALGGFIYMRGYFDAPGAKPVRSVADAVGAKRVLGVFAHPDDEQLVTGLFSSADKGGLFTAMVTATKGEAGHQVPAVARQADLGVVRKAEALKNGFALGVDVQEVWDYADGGVPDVPVEELVARIVAAVEATKPDLVVTFWPASGATGHKDHMRVGFAAETAAKQLQASGSGPRWIAYIITPPDGLRAFGGETGKVVADNQPAATHATPGNTAAKLRGWRIHASQRDYVQSAYGFPDWLLYALWDQEFYRVEELK